MNSLRLLVIVVTAVFLRTVSCQMDCAFPTNNIIEKGIEDVLEPAQGQKPTVTLLRWEPVCLAYSQMIDRYRGISVVAEYNCINGSTCPMVQPATEQFEFACDSTSRVWVTTVLGASSGQRSPSPNATFSTPLREDCAFCISPASAMVTDANPDDINHCSPCDPACTAGGGLERCFGALSMQCCNVYDGSTCAEDCPTNFKPDNSTGVCVCLPGTTGANCDQDIDCLDLTDPENGSVDFENTTFGSDATYSCNDGFFLIGDDTRTCQTDGWSGNDPTCGECPANCLRCTSANKCSACVNGYKLDNNDLCVPDCNIEKCISCSDPTKCDRCDTGYRPNSDGTECILNCTVEGCASCSSADKCDVCESGRSLDSSQSACVTGDRNDDGGLPIGAIIGIILAIIALAIILALLTALIIYLLKRHWDKVHLKGKDLNHNPGVPHDNPLYVGPNDLDDVDKGAATTPTNGDAVLPKPESQSGADGGELGQDSNGSE